MYDCSEIGRKNCIQYLIGNLSLTPYFSPAGRRRMTLQEAFLVHKKTFITDSARRLQDVKDGLLQIKHPQLLKQEATKRIVGSVPHGK